MDEEVGVASVQRQLAAARLDNALTARLLLTVGTVMYSFVPLVVDLTETHVFHPDWPGHARFHMVWLLGMLLGVGLAALYFVWRRSEDETTSIRLGGVLGLISLGAFFVSAATAGLYGGTLSDAGGVPDLDGLNVNVLAFSVALALLTTGLLLARKADPW
jgi:MFS family permease